MASHLWELELLPSRYMKDLAADIGDLAKRSLENNIFFEPEFLTSAYPRLTRILTPKGNWMMCLWETTPNGRTLRMFMPLSVQNRGLPRRALTTSLSNEYAPLGTPLLCNELADETAENFLHLIADPALELPSVLNLTDQRLVGPVAEKIEAAATRLGLSCARTQLEQRAILHPADDDPATFIRTSIGKKRQREYARQLRRLGEQGKVTFKIARTENDILDAFEGFLSLELKGWKGRRGTALYNQKRIAAFSRQTVASLAAKSACEIHSLRLDDKTIASLIILGRGGELFTWKTAFNEDYAPFSPGVQVMLHATEHLAGRKDLISADSLAVANHPMMDHLWRDRAEIGSILIGLRTSDDELLQDAVSGIEKERQLKERAKNMLGWLRCVIRKKSLRKC